MHHLVDDGRCYDGIEVPRDLGRVKGSIGIQTLGQMQGQASLKYPKNECSTRKDRSQKLVVTSAHGKRPVRCSSSAEPERRLPKCIPAAEHIIAVSWISEGKV
jgi:hypothetical protein